MAPAPPAVLLVDDDPTAQSIALSMLRHLGVEADAASDGAEGVRMATSQPYDVVLMDLQMPVLDGAEAVRAIRAAPDGDRPRILALADRARPLAASRMAAIGFDGVATKPFSMAGLQNALWPPAEAQPPATPSASPSTSGLPDALMSEVRAHVRALLGEDDEAFVVDLVEAFATSTRNGLSVVDAVRQTRDDDALITLAHALKGSAANIGLVSLADLWDGVEAVARHGDDRAFGTPLTDAVARTRQALGEE